MFFMIVFVFKQYVVKYYRKLDYYLGITEKLEKVFYCRIRFPINLNSQNEG